MNSAYFRNNLGTFRKWRPNLVNPERYSLGTVLTQVAGALAFLFQRPAPEPLVALRNERFLPLGLRRSRRPLLLLSRSGYAPVNSRADPVRTQASRCPGGRAL